MQKLTRAKFLGQEVFESETNRWHFKDEKLPQTAIQIDLSRLINNYDFAKIPKIDTQEHKDEWLQALRSRQYKQGMKHLGYEIGNGEFYCCLGIYCELRKMPKIIATTSLRTNVFHYGENQSSGLLPFEIHGEVTSQKQLAVLNDSRWTFEEIAKVIEICYVVRENVAVEK